MGEQAMDGQSGVSPEILPLPKGGGAIRSIGETFSPDLHAGTGNYRIPLWFPRGPGKFQPDMGIVYSSGAGNGPFGMGWHLPVMKISRRTDRGLPNYNDDLDTFLLDGEEIVPVGNGRFRYRREDHFRRIERIGDGWEVRDRGGRRFILGATAAARIEETKGDVTRVYAWLIERAIDTNGNEINYSYHRDNGQLYLKSITYSIYSISFIHEVRPDPFTERRAGFDITTALRYTAIEYEIKEDPDPLFRRYKLTYDECPYTRLSLLASVTFSGHRTGAVGPETVALPTLRFTYTTFKPSHRYQTFVSKACEPPPFSLDDPDFDLLDLYSTGLPGVIQLGGSIHRFWPNKGQGHWGPPQSLHQLPSEVALSDPAVGFADADGNGTADLIILSESPLGYYVNEPGRGWTHRARFHRTPTFNPSDPDLRLLDLNGDGLVDAMRTSQRMFNLYYNRGDAGWDLPVNIARVRDLARFPDIFFSDRRVKLADMTGDGLIDIVWVHKGCLDYWPHYGNGHFGPRIRLALQPPISISFDPERLFLSDINGDGVADVVYVESDRVILWINQGGNALVSAGIIRYTPPTNGRNVQLADMFGTGTSGLVWSYPFSRIEQHNYKYMDFTGGVRPYLLASINDGTGLVTTIEYEPSTKHALAAEAEGRPWKSTLPFPVQTVSRIIQSDSISGTVVTRNIRYYDGFFDGKDREFRGFGRAEVLEEGDIEVPTTLTISYFLQGGRGITPGVNQELRRALSGKLYRLEVFSPDGSAQASQPYRIEENSYQARELEVGLNGKSVVFPYLAESHVSTYERTATSIVDNTSLIYDDFGNVVHKHESWTSGGQTQELITNMVYTVDTNHWILNLPVELIRTDGTGQLLSLRRFYYDGDPLVGLPLGQVEKGNLSRREDMVLTDDAISTVYGAEAPNYTSLGYHRMIASIGQDGWGSNSLRQIFDAQGNVTERTGALENTGRIIYDANHIYPIQITDPMNHVYDVTYDVRAGEISQISEPNGYETRYCYDPLGRLVAMIKPGDNDTFPTAEFEYLDSALPLGVSTRLRHRAGDPSTLDDVEYFDGFQKTIQRRSSAEDGKVIVDGWRRYNRRGWEAERTSPFFSIGFLYVADEGRNEARRYRFKYDALGRVVETVTPDNRPANTIYGPGTITRYDVSDTDDSPENVARGHFNTPRREEYDARGRLLTITEQNIGESILTTLYTLDPMGHLLRITDARGVQTATYVYDLMGRKIQVEHVDAGKLRVAHNARGGLSLIIDAAGRRTETCYDVLGRRAQILVDGVLTERYEYDIGEGNNLIGRLARVQDEAGELQFSYTPRGLVEEKTRHVQTLSGLASFTVRYAYDSLERMTQVTHPDGAPITYHYNNRGLLKKINNFVDNITYNAVGQTTEVQYTNGVQENYSFDELTFYLQEALINGPTRPAPYYQMSYIYDAIGNPLTMIDGVSAPSHPDFERHFTYDALYRLTSVNGTLDGTAFSHIYDYDGAGNFLINEEFRPEELYLESGGKNQIQGFRVGATETQLFDYDVSGNLISTPDMILEFDARSRLIRATKTDGTMVEYTYGYLGERVRKRVTHGNVTSETIYVDQLYEIRDGQATCFIFNENVRVAAATVGGGTYFFHHDHLGNTILITDVTGGIVHEVGYYPFGNVAFAIGGNPSSYQFMGNEWDSETGLVYSRSRYYDPRLGRFISPDLFVLMNPEKLLSLPVNLNLYGYAANNPMRLVDDEGSWWKWLVGGLIIAALAVATIVVGVFTGGAGFAFGILLAATIGSALGSGIGVYAAWRGGGDLADGFLFGTLVGGAAGAAGYALGAAVGLAGISGVWGSILSGGVQGAIVGAGSGAIIGYAGGAGTLQDILIQGAIGFGVGLVLGGVAGAVSYYRPDFPGVLSRAFGGSERISEASRPFWAGVGRVTGWVPQILVTNNAIYTPTLFIGFGSIAHAAIRFQWSDIQALCPEGKDCVISYDFEF